MNTGIHENARKKQANLGIYENAHIRYMDIYRYTHNSVIVVAMPIIPFG
jgi:hypothetical protein